MFRLPRMQLPNRSDGSADDHSYAWITAPLAESSEYGGGDGLEHLRLSTIGGGSSGQASMGETPRGENQAGELTTKQAATMDV
jgi:hypothetical protein